MTTVTRKVIRLEDVPLRNIGEPSWVDKGGNSRDQGRFKELISTEVCGSTDLMLGISFMDPGEVHLLHYHPDAAEFYYILSGRCKITVGEEVVDAVPGMAIYFPKGCNHKIVVDGPEAVSFIYGFDRPDFTQCGCVWLE